MFSIIELLIIITMKSIKKNQQVKKKSISEKTQLNNQNGVEKMNPKVDFDEDFVEHQKQVSELLKKLKKSYNPDQIN